MVRQRQRFAALLTLLIATVVVSLALAQPRGHKPKPRTDAGAETPSGDETAQPGASPTSATAGSAPAAADAGPVAVPRPEVGPGGVKPSPLNPAPNEMPGAPGAGPAPSASAAVDYDKLLADIAALRARVAAVADNLFVSRIGITVETDGDHGKIGRFVVSIDDGVVYTGAPGFRADDPVAVYDHAVAPGRHAVTVDVERRDDRDESFRSSQRSRFVVDVPKDDKLNVALRIGDDSSMGADFPSDRSGKYDLRVRMKASAVSVKR